MRHIISLSAAMTIAAFPALAAPGAEAVALAADRYAEIIFPLNSGADFRWEPGKAYRYTLTIGVPQTDDNLINFDVTVDEYGTFTDL